ncbi:MAG: hypothetical protein F6K55_35570 [Moorea sp. SIO4A3]|nr:hypothetical protein [Moorena sp. SIO4A3]
MCITIASMPIACSLFFIACSLFPVPCSLKPETMYLMNIIITISCFLKL